MSFPEPAHADVPLAEITRGDRVESVHYGSVAVTDDTGKLLLSLGDVETPVFPRSTVKALQALPLIETGATDHFGLTGPELALACASHAGEPEHAATALQMLRRTGRDADSLECGTHWPTRPEATRSLAAQGESPCALHNNCSGKHAGFICTACAEQTDPAGYIRPDHPVMQRVTQTLAEMTGIPHTDRNRGTDGCSIPTYAIPLQALARAFACFGTGTGLHPDRARAATRLREAVAGHPFMISGTDGFDTVVMQSTGIKAFTKIGAEGVLIASLPDSGLGIAIKCRDGALRGAESAMAALLLRFGGTDIPDSAPLASQMTRTLTNWNGTTVGTVRPSFFLKKSLTRPA
ncbi:asparaginase [Acetobacter sp. AN02]|uniref:asparaginase n=1 Tax=Acetobacter sp. AN02 TaxID=2894186 RepID=UPI0024342764|nr:asparaginase [Acetobacter sp. AN02]MDG6095765.1 asparaginase [Acetobacter sp. AN02]